MLVGLLVSRGPVCALVVLDREVADLRRFFSATCDRDICLVCPLRCS